MKEKEIVTDILESMARSIQNLTVIVQILADKSKELEKRLKALEEGEQ